NGLCIFFPFLTAGPRFALETTVASRTVLSKTRGPAGGKGGPSLVRGWAEEDGITPLEKLKNRGRPTRQKTGAPLNPSGKVPSNSGAPIPRRPFSFSNGLSICGI